MICVCNELSCCWRVEGGGDMRVGVVDANETFGDVGLSKKNRSRRILWHYLRVLREVGYLGGKKDICLHLCVVFHHMCEREV